MKDISDKEKDKILELLEELKQDNILIIVEGANDKKALEFFGLRNIKTLANRTLYRVVEEVEATHKDKEVVILTDLDKEGKSLYSILYTDLTQRGIKVNNKFRNFLSNDTKLRQIEGLKRYLEE
jgi:5S rRNA maturation endonuclease (ribonuclease M5)